MKFEVGKPIAVQLTDGRSLRGFVHAEDKGAGILCLELIPSAETALLPTVNVKTVSAISNQVPARRWPANRELSTILRFAPGQKFASDVLRYMIYTKLSRVKTVADIHLFLPVAACALSLLRLNLKPLWTSRRSKLRKIVSSARTRTSSICWALEFQHLHKRFSTP